MKVGTVVIRHFEYDIYDQGQDTHVFLGKIIQRDNAPLRFKSLQDMLTMDQINQIHKVMASLENDK